MFLARRMAPAVLFFGLAAPLFSQGRYDAESDAKKLEARVPAEERLAAMRNLLAAGRQSVPTLCDVIESAKEPFTKQAAATILQDILRLPENRDDQTLSRLTTMLSSKDRFLAHLGPNLLMQYKGNQQAKGALIKAIQKETNERRREELFEALAYNLSEDKSAIPLLAGFLDDRSEYVRIAAAGALGKLGDKRGLKLCRDILSREPSSKQTRLLQIRAIAAARNIGNPALIPTLQKFSSSAKGLDQTRARWAIKDIELGAIADKDKQFEYLKEAMGNRDTARWAMKHLLAFKDPAASSILREATQSNDPTVRKEANWALAALNREKTLFYEKK